MCSFDDFISQVYMLPTFDKWTSKMAELKCNFTEMLKYCFIQNKSDISKTLDLTIYDFMYVIQVLEFFGSVVTFPVVACLGFILNMLVVLVLRHKPNKQKHFKKKTGFSTSSL